MKKRLSILLALSLCLPGTLAIAAEEDKMGNTETYVVEHNDVDDFYIVTNPNGGATLSYTSVDLLEITEDGYTYAFKDLDRDGELDVYEDWREDYAVRAADLTSKLSLEEAAGLMLHSLHTSPEDEEGNYTDYQYKLVTENHLRTMLYTGRSNTSDMSTHWTNSLQFVAEAQPLGIPMNFSSDPRISATDVETAISTTASGSCWPTNLALAATFNPDWTFLSAQAIAKEYRALGLNVALSPQIDLATEPRWRRFSGTFGEDVDLTRDMAVAYVSALQSTWDGVGTDATDLGWGEDSVIAMVKHFPGDGSGEAGRESHVNAGKYAVYPGDNMAEHYSIFDATFHLDTLTESAMAVMPSYSIAYNKFGPIGDPVASGYNSYKLTTLLREKLGFDHLICSDWAITMDNWTPWGVEDLTLVERYMLALESGMGQFGGDDYVKPMIDAYQVGSTVNSVDATEGFFVRSATEEFDGSTIYNEIFYENAEKVLYNAFITGMFENPYVSSKYAEELFTNRENAELAYEAQLDSVILLKNSGNVLGIATGEKKTVYIPMEINQDSQNIIDSETAHENKDWSHVGFEDMTFDGSIAYSFDWDLANEYFNVVTDTIREGADLNNLTEEDIIRRNDFTGVDFALVSVDAPLFMGRGYDASKVDLDGSDGSIDNGYYPISLIYNDYYADPEVVREYPIGTDPSEELEWTAAGGEAGRSRYYGGKTTSGDKTDLDLMLNTRKTVGDLPIVVSITSSNPFCLYEFESEVDAIVLGLGVSSRAVLENVAGLHEPQGLLPMQLPANMQTVELQYEDVGRDMECHIDTDGNVYDFAFGMNWSGVIEDERTAQYK